VNDGKQAVAYLNGEGRFANRKEFPFPTFIFIDLKMPQLDGFGVLKHIKENEQWAIIPTLVFCSSVDQHDIKKAFSLGACAYHVKPGTSGARQRLCRLLLDYWATSEVPETNEKGEQLPTSSVGKLGEHAAPYGSYGGQRIDLPM
jgi:CheY-like chemotaxis protein